MDVKNPSEIWGDRDKKSIEEWTTAGLMTPERIMLRLDAQIGEYTFYDSIPTIRGHFNALCTEKSGLQVLEEPAFVSFLARSFTPSFPLIKEAGPILYESAVYLAGFPFMPKVSPLLTLGAFLRALALMLPDRANRWISGCCSCTPEGLERLVARERTAADHQRLLFQSLADTHEASFGAGLVEYSLRDAREAQEVVPWTLKGGDTSNTFDFSAPSKDADGDEMYHDLLDVLSATQPVEHPGALRVSRDSLRPHATKFHNTQLSLRRMAIRREKFVTLVKLLLSMRLGDASPLGARFTDKLADLEAIAERIVNAFTEESGDTENITWSTFDFAMNRVAPHLFDSLYRLLNSFLLSPDHRPQSPQNHVFPKAGHILTLPVLAQVGLVLSETVSFDDYRLLYHRTVPASTTLVSTHSQDLSTLIQTIKTQPEVSLLLVRGSSDAKDTVTFAVYFSNFPTPCSDETVTNRENGCEGSLIFQLEPVYDVYRARPHKKAWAVSADGFWFGEPGAGVALGLTDGLQHGRFLHQVDSNGAYEANPRKGLFEVGFTVHEIEVWGENM